MLDPSALDDIRAHIRERLGEDSRVLEELRSDVRSLVERQRRIRPRAATAVSLVATDGGNNQLRFDPFLIQLVRVVDSNQNQRCLEVISPSMPINELNRRQMDAEGNPQGPLGRMMRDLDIRRLEELSPMIQPGHDGAPRSPSAVQVYRELMEWAVLYDLLKMEYGSDTLIVFDGNLRSKVFAGELFAQLGRLLETEIARHATRNRRISLVGVMKTSKVLDRYRLTMALERVLRSNYPAYVEVPRELEENVYLWNEYARGRDSADDGGEAAKFVLGKMFFVKFGDRTQDPIWPVDIFESQAGDADRILSHLLADAREGFPVPLYPRCLQKAHEAAALVGFDMAVLQDSILDGFRDLLGREAETLDVFRLGDDNPAQGRYR